MRFSSGMNGNHLLACEKREYCCRHWKDEETDGETDGFKRETSYPCARLLVPRHHLATTETTDGLSLLHFLSFRLAFVRPFVVLLSQ